jgi:hypothetical protein
MTVGLTTDDADRQSSHTRDNQIQRRRSVLVSSGRFGRRASQHADLVSQGQDLQLQEQHAWAPLIARYDDGKQNVVHRVWHLER